MRKFWGFYDNGKFRVGCSGAAVYVYDSNDKELAKFKDFPYTYRAAFMPVKNIIAVKSTAGYLGFYDLDKSALIKKYNVITKNGAHEEGFLFTADGRFFYNIESPITAIETQLGIYETETFSKVETLFADEKLMFLEHMEIDSDTGKCYISGYMRNPDTLIFGYGFVGIFDEKTYRITDIRIPDDKIYRYLDAYKDWELDGFTPKSLEWNYTLKELREIPPISIKKVHCDCKIK